METNEPKTLDKLIEEMESHSSRYDFSDEYLLENGHQLPIMGEFLYGVSHTPTGWVLPYLRELKKLRDQVEVEEVKKVNKIQKVNTKSRKRE